MKTWWLWWTRYVIQWEKQLYTEFSIRGILRKQWMELVHDRLKWQGKDIHKEVKKSGSSNRMGQSPLWVYSMFQLTKVYLEFYLARKICCSAARFNRWRRQVRPLHQTTTFWISNIFQCCHLCLGLLSVPYPSGFKTIFYEQFYTCHVQRISCPNHRSDPITIITHDNRSFF
jgi:hypothetical protein